MDPRIYMDVEWLLFELSLDGHLINHEMTVLFSDYIKKGIDNGSRDEIYTRTIRIAFLCRRFQAVAKPNEVELLKTYRTAVLTPYIRECRDQEARILYGSKDAVVAARASIPPELRKDVAALLRGLLIEQHNRKQADV